MKQWPAHLYFLLILTFCFTLFTKPCISEEKTLRLSLRECIDRALVENLGLKQDYLSLSFNDFSIESAKAKFDPSLSFQLNRNESVQPNYYEYIPVKSIEQENTNFSMSLNKSVALGGAWRIGMSNTLSESNIEREKNYSNYFGLSFDQPLIRGYGKKATLSAIYLAELDKESTIYDVRNRAISLVYNVQNTYWELVYNRQILKVFEMSLAQADSLLTYNQKGLEMGILTQSEVLEAKSAVLSRKQEILQQKNAISNTEDNLKILLNLTTEDKWNSIIIPSDTPSTPSVELDADRALRDALDYRPEWCKAMNDIKQQEFRIDIARNYMRVSLNLNAGYQFYGSGSDLGKSFDDMGDIEKFGWQVGLNLVYPLGNREAKISFARSKVILKQSQLNMADLKNTIMADIRSSIRNVRMIGESIDVASLSVDVNKLKLRQEEQKFRNQLSTSYLVLEYQRDLANASSQYNKAIMDYNMSVVEYKRSRGTLLKDLDITIINRKY